MVIQLEGTTPDFPEYDENVQQSFTIFFVKFEQSCSADDCGFACTNSFEVVGQSFIHHNPGFGSPAPINDNL